VNEFEVIASRVLIDDVDVRDSTEGRIVFGTVVPFNTVAEVNDGAGPYREMFAPGAFARSIEQRTDKVKLLTNHDGRKLPVGRATLLEERDSGLYGEFLVSRNASHLLDDVTDRIVDSFSIGFRGIKATKRDGVVVRTEAQIREVSIVGFPAYAGALIGGVRSNDDLFAELADRFGLTAEQVVERLALADPGTGTQDPPVGHALAAVRAAQLRDLDSTLHLLKGRS
jgi:HK97 family phage prohead protease